MENVKDFLLKILKKGVQISLNETEDRIRVVGNTGSLTEEDKTNITHYKEDLIKLLRLNSRQDKNAMVEIPKIQDSTSYEISDAQRRLWILSQFEDGLLAYNMPNEVYLNHEIDLNHFQHAVQLTIVRHEILRTVFKKDVDGIVRQLVLSPQELGFVIDSKDYRNVSNKYEFVSNYIESDSAKGFDLENGPLLRAALLQVEDQGFVFYYNMHHIISDGWSMEILARDVLAYYESYTSGRELSLPDLRIQYRDYSSWQLDQLKNAAYNAHKEFWRNSLSGSIPVLELPTTKKRPRVKTYKGAGFSAYLNKRTTGNLKKYIKQNGGSLFMGLLAAWKVLMYRYTSEVDVVIGTPVAGREHSDLEDQIGFYVNTLALRNKLNPNDSFDAFYKQIKDSIVKSFSHQMYPFDRLVEDLNLQVDTSRSVLFDIMLTLQNIDEKAPAPSISLSEIEEIQTIGVNTSKFDITLGVEDRGEYLYLELTYNPDIYEEEMIKGLIIHFKSIISSLLDNPELPVSRVDYLLPTEKSALLSYETPAIFPVESTVVSLFETQVDLTPDYVAVVFENESLTYAQLDEKSNQLSAYLKSKYSIQRGDLIAIKLPRGIDMIVCILAVLKSGGAYVPVDPDNPAERISFIEEDSGCKVSIDESILSDFLAVQSDYSKARTITELNPNDLAYIIYTSGSTGRPKGVMVTHQNVVRLFKTEPSLFDFNQSDVWTLFHSYAFDFSVWEIFGALLFGGKLVVVPKVVSQDPALYLELLSREKVTVLNQTPSAFYNLSNTLEESNMPLSVRYVIFGGEALSPAHLSFWSSVFPHCKLVNMYGITEATVHTTYKLIGEDEISSNQSNIGRPIPTVHCLILDENRNLVPQGVKGELYIGGYGVASGYLNREELTSERFIANPYNQDGIVYRTGDSVRLLNNGEMEYLGRIDNQVKIRGHRIELGEIEHILERYPMLDQVVVIAIENSNKEKELVAYLVSKGDQNTTDLRAYLETHLPPYMIPVSFVQLEEFPLTNNGKVDRKKLPAPEKMALSTGVEYVPPRNEMEATLVSIWEEVLKKSEIGVKDNFFAMGGDSMKSIQIVTRVKKKTGKLLKVSELYNYQTIEVLSEMLMERSWQSVDEDLVEGKKLLETFKNKWKIEVEANEFVTDYEDFYPISKLEQGMIFSSLMNPNEPVYYDQFIYDLTINELDLFKKAVRLIVDRHPMLRTKYFMDTFGEPLKLVLEKIELPLIVEDIAGYTEHQINQKINEETQRLLDRRLTFNNELLWSLNLYRVKGNDHLVVFCFHHALLDGWSTSIFRSELTQLLAKNNQVDLPAVKSKYQDYVAIQLGRKDSQETKVYWRNMLHGYERNKLPFNYTRTRISDETRMYDQSVFLGKSVLSRLENTAENEQVSLKAIFLSAHLYMLNLLSTEKDVVTGVVTHDRPELEDAEKIMGCFLYTTPVRINFENISTLKELLHFSQKYLINVKAHEVHLTDIVRFIDERAGSENPIFDTLLNFTDFHQDYDIHDSEAIAETNEIVGEDVGVSNEMTNTYFDMEVDKTFNRLLLKIKYVPAIFSPSEIEYALFIYESILRQIAENVNQPLEPKLLMLNTPEKFVFEEFNNAVVAYSNNKSLSNLFEEQTAKTPNAIALRQDGQTMTYDELNKKANQLSGKLIRLGVQPGDNIGVLVDRSFEMIACMYAILKSGGAYVPIDPEYPMDRQQYIMENSDVKMVLYDAAYPITEDFSEVEFIHLDNVELSSYSSHNPGIKVDKHDLAYTIYTSGSTGRPKGVMIEHHSAVNLVEWVNNEFNIGENDRLLFITSMCFDLSVYDIFGMLAAGGSIVIATKEQVQNVHALTSIMKEERITFWDSVPTTMNYLVDELIYLEEVFEQNDLRLVFLSGDWIPVHLPNKIKKYFPNASVISLGGATEGTVWSNYYPIESVDEMWSSIPYGKPIANNYFYILDSNLNPVPPGVAGDLYIGGVGVARGYANDPEKTRASFVEDPFDQRLGGRMYRTGDLGRMLVTGNMEFLGRADHQVKIRGFRVELGEIESILSKMDGIKEAVVDVVSDEQNNNQLAAYFVVNKEEMNPVTIREYLQQHLPNYMIPLFFIKMDALPLTSNGKINRKALPSPSNQELERQTEFVAPRNEIEETIAEIWQEILGIEQIGVLDDFFELGGHSLAATRLLTRVQKIFNVKIELKNLFIEPTISGLAGAVSTLKWMKEKSSEVSSEEDEMII